MLCLDLNLFHHLSGEWLPDWFKILLTNSTIPLHLRCGWLKAECTAVKVEDLMKSLHKEFKDYDLT